MLSRRAALSSNASLKLPPFLVSYTVTCRKTSETGSLELSQCIPQIICQRLLENILQLHIVIARLTTCNYVYTYHRSLGAQ